MEFCLCSSASLVITPAPLPSSSALFEPAETHHMLQLTQSWGVPSAPWPCHSRAHCVSVSVRASCLRTSVLQRNFIVLYMPERAQACLTEGPNLSLNSRKPESQPYFSVSALPKATIDHHCLSETRHLIFADKVCLQRDPKVFNCLH